MKNHTLPFRRGRGYARIASNDPRWREQCDHPYDLAAIALTASYYRQQPVRRDLQQTVFQKIVPDALAYRR